MKGIWAKNQDQEYVSESRFKIKIQDRDQDRVIEKYVNTY
jgi:hypothetical protein